MKKHYNKYPPGFSQGVTLDTILNDSAFKYYGITRNGIVFSCHSNRKGEYWDWKPIKQGKTVNYYSVGLVKENGTYKRVFVHRLIAIAFIPNPENKKEVNHINGIKTDNRIENLEWCTRRENAVHAVSMGLCPNNKGERHGLSKLKESNIREIFDLHKNGKSIKHISLLFSVDIRTIWKIINKQRWGHVVT